VIVWRQREVLGIDNRPVACARVRNNCHSVQRRVGESKTGDVGGVIEVQNKVYLEIGFLTAGTTAS
jgi:hypothetical protein